MQSIKLKEDAHLGWRNTGCLQLVPKSLEVIHGLDANHIAARVTRGPYRDGLVPVHRKELVQVRVCGAAARRAEAIDGLLRPTSAHALEGVRDHVAYPGVWVDQRVGGE